jgi:O-antigen ligase
MRVHSRIAEHIFTVISLLLYTGGPLLLILSGGLSEGDALQTATPDNNLIKLCFQLIYIITLFYIVPHWKSAVYLLVKDKLILLLMIIIFLSCLWSVDPERTIGRSVAIFGTTLFGVYFATRYSLKQQLYLLGWVFGLASLISIFFVLALPQYGKMAGFHFGAWRGIYVHKNVLGTMMILSTYTFLILDASDRKKNWIFRTLFFLSIVLLWKSDSSSSVINLLFIMSVFIVSKALRWEYRLKAAVLALSTAFSFILYIWLVVQADAVANLFGKDLTLSGRTQLWDLVWEFIHKKPWLGYGYGALWSGGNRDTRVIWSAIGWEAPNSHNGFLEVWLGLGVLGLSVLVIHMVTNFMKILILIGQTRAAVYFLPMVVILFNVLSSTTEANLMDRNSIIWVLYVSVVLSLQLKSNISENEPFSSSLHKDRKLLRANL